jgi:hypothetical protein
VPGSGYEMRCSGCAIVHEVWTGADRCREHGEPWTYQQYVCPSCLQLKSRQTVTCCRPDPLVCEACGSDLVPWSGRVWHEGTAGPEHVDGPCPRCGRTLRETDSPRIARWD